MDKARKPGSSRLLGLSGPKDRVKRFAIQLPLRNKTFTPQIPAQITNLGPMGAFLETVPEREGRIVDLEFSFPGQVGSFRVTGRVLWSRGGKGANLEKGQPMGCGIRFLHFNQGSPEELKTLLEAWSELNEQAQAAHLKVVAPEPSEAAQEALEIVSIPWNFHETEIDAALSPFFPEKN